jgi:hypothetical protein
MSDMYQALSEPFPQEMERSVSKSGRSLTYIPISEVISRLNKVIGAGNWSSEIITCHRDAIDPHWVIAQVRVTALIDDKWVSKDGVGGQQVKMTKAGQILDLGDEFKGAMSDALKKAVQQLGVGLYLARNIDAIEAEEALYAPPPAKTDPKIEELFKQIKDFKSKMDKDASDALDQFWNDYSDNKPKPTKSNATVEDLQAIVGECVRLTMGGEFVESE